MKAQDKNGLSQGDRVFWQGRNGKHAVDQFGRRFRILVLVGSKNGSEIAVILPFAIFGSMRTVVRSRRREKISFDYLFSRSLPPHVYGIESIFLQFWVGLFVATTPLVAYVMMSAW